MELLDIETFDLCQHHTKELWMSVWASIKNGCLSISGQDFDDKSDMGYEYTYSFSKLHTQYLIMFLLDEHGDEKDVIFADEVKQLLCDNFSGIGGCGKLSNFCKKYGIRYSIWTHYSI
jgi:hypothetical protein